MKDKGLRIGQIMLWLLWTPLFSHSQENLIPNWSFEELRFPDSEFGLATFERTVS